jgi:flagellar hook-basal body complex protein FliE
MSSVVSSGINLNSNIFSNEVTNKSIPQTDTNNSNDKVDFGEVLKNAVDKVNDEQINANNDIESLIKGDNNITMHQVMLSSQESQMSMQLMIEMRNKLYDAYKELSSVQL